MYTRDERKVDKALCSAYFKGIDGIGPAYELESRKMSVRIDHPYQVGIAVYQLAKIRILEFYYDFFDKYIDHRDFELVQKDTDNF